jgi:hypothetical protein
MGKVEFQVVTRLQAFDHDLSGLRAPMRKLIANLTENARLFAETRKLLGSGGKVFEVVEDEQEQAPEVAAAFYPPMVNGSSAAEGVIPGSPPDTTPASPKPSSPENSIAPPGGNGSGKPHTCGTPSSS